MEYKRMITTDETCKKSLKWMEYKRVVTTDGI
jgi:hypothetical protein